jgi:hypothetical protein
VSAPPGVFLGFWPSAPTRAALGTFGKALRFNRNFSADSTIFLPRNMSEGRQWRRVESTVVLPAGGNRGAISYSRLPVNMRIDVAVESAWPESGQRPDAADETGTLTIGQLAREYGDMLAGSTKLRSDASNASSRSGCWSASNAISKARCTNCGRSVPACSSPPRPTDSPARPRRPDGAFPTLGSEVNRRRQAGDRWRFAHGAGAGLKPRQFVR